jgi:hypothetical protein
MYNIKLTVGNKVFKGVLLGENLTDEQIRQKGLAMFQTSINMHKAKTVLKEHEKVDGQKIDETMLDPIKIEYQKVGTEAEGGIEKIYEIADLTGLTRQQLLEQEILTKRKLVKIGEALLELARQERDEIENSLKEEVIENGR